MKTSLIRAVVALSVLCSFPFVAAPVSLAHDTGGEHGHEEPVLRLYASEESTNLDAIVAALKKAAEVRGLTYAQYDMADEEVFRALLRIEDERGITNFDNVELFAGDRFFAGHEEVLHFLEGFAEGKETLEEPVEAVPNAGTSANMRPTRMPGMPGIPGGTPLTLTPIAPSGSPPSGQSQGNGVVGSQNLQAEFVISNRVSVTVGPWQRLREWYDAAVAPYQTYVVLALGLALGMGGAWLLRKFLGRRFVPAAGKGGPTP